MADIIQAQGPEELLKVLNGLLGQKERHQLLYRLGNQKVAILVDTKESPSQIWFKETEGRSAPKVVKDTLGKFLWNNLNNSSGNYEDWYKTNFENYAHDYYSTVKDRILQESISGESSYHDHSVEQAWKDLAHAIAIDAWQQKSKSDLQQRIPSMPTKDYATKGLFDFGFFNKKKEDVPSKGKTVKGEASEEKTHQKKIK